MKPSLSLHQAHMHIHTTKHVYTEDKSQYQAWAISVASTI